ncbi:unnamed protein product [Candidula unifasciata]|uniref:Membrane protein BRI3 n=1 Tax=Candidula unifasciata TaxID=100452 RepID=A0A8S3ZD69_9EUPU|nr:unnamed protein product [Candidula unifasciata]
MSVPSDKPPSYNNSMASNPGYQPSYGTIGGVPAGTYQPAGGAYQPAGGAYQPAGGAYPPPAGAVPSYNQSHTNIVVQPPHSIVIVGGCPACRVGVLEEDFTCLGVFCAIFFFPIGILCCLAMRQRRCANCGAVFG